MPSDPGRASERAAAVQAAAGDDADLKRQLDALTPEQADMFVRALELAMRKRRVLLAGYLATILALIVGMIWALYIYGATLGSGQFMAWVFLVPLTLAGSIMFLFGRYARRLK